MFELLRPHVVQAHINLMATRAEAAEAARSAAIPEQAGMGLATVLLDARGRGRSYGPQSIEMLDRYFHKGRKQSAGELPRRLQQWVRQQLSSLVECSVPGMAVLHPLFLETETGQLTVRLLSARDGQLSLQLCERPNPRRQCEYGYGLSPRTRRVLKLLLEGLSEKEVAVSLKLSRHTVHEYVKMIYARVGVTSRGELLATFLTKT